MRFRLRTLLIVLALLPPILALVAPPVVQWFKHKPPVAPATAMARVYPLQGVDAAEAAQVVRALLSGSTSRVALDPASNSLFVAGQPADHAMVQSAIKALQERSPPSTPADVERVIQIAPYRQ